MLPKLATWAGIFTIRSEMDNPVVVWDLHLSCVPTGGGGWFCSSSVGENHLKTLLKTQFSWLHLQRSSLSGFTMDPKMLILK